jgi:exopolyphosphatase/guanosine-5'-triphosphate,3'-diphosphate pyrophosphatase
VIVGAVDIGTNTVRLLIAEVLGGAVRYRDSRVVVTGLGTGLEATGRLGGSQMQRSLDVLATFRLMCEQAGVQRMAAVATSATRDASNSRLFLEGAAGALGMMPRVISGDEEAVLSFRGVTSGLDPVRPVLVIDPGGGSTEFVLGDAEPAYATSVDVGSVRLAERALPDRPASAEQVAAASAEAARELGVVDLPSPPASVVGVGGTYTALGAMALELLRYDRARVHGSVLTQAGLDELVDGLGKLSIAETEAIPSLDPARAPAMLGGAIVAAEALRHSGVGSLTVSESGLLHGLALTA